MLLQFSDVAGRSNLPRRSASSVAAAPAPGLGGRLFPVGCLTPVGPELAASCLAAAPSATSPAATSTCAPGSAPPLTPLGVTPPQK
jgi:hypothetical protein